MELIWKAIKTTGGVLRLMWQDMQGHGGDYEYSHSCSWPEARDDSGSGMQVHMLPPAEHNGWGTVADYTYGMPGD